MKTILSILALTIVFTVRPHDDAPSSAPGAPAAEAAPIKGETLLVETQRSVLRWRGTKFRGTASHEGVVRLASGTIQVQNGQVTGGAFVIDMQSIEITDIPKSDPKPRKSLRNHLLSDHFFAADSYPTARFAITRVEPVEGSTYRLTGDLAMRGQTHPVTFDAQIVVRSDASVHAAAQFSIDRHVWGVSDRDCRLVRFVVDDDIHLDLSLFADRV